MKKMSEKEIRNRIKRFLKSEFQGIYTILWTAKLLEKGINGTAKKVLFQMCEEGLFEIAEKTVGNVTYYSVRKK